MEKISHYIKIADIDNFSTGATIAEKQEVIDRVEEIIEETTNDVFYPKTFHIFLDGNGKNRIFPFLKSDILSVNKLVISDLTIGEIDYTGSNISGTSGATTVALTSTSTALNTDYYENDYLGIYDTSESTDFYWGSRIISHTSSTVGGAATFTIEKALPMTLTTDDTVSILYNWDFDSNSIWRSTEASTHEPNTLMKPVELMVLEGYFPKGNKNIEVWGTKGWHSCPKSVKRACVILAKYENDNTLYTFYNDGIKSEKLGDYGYSKFSDSEKSGGGLTGVSAADRLLKLYVKKKAILGVA